MKKEIPIRYQISDNFEKGNSYQTLKCPKCGEEMKIVSFIERHHQSEVIERILKHCNLWKDKIPRSPPQTEKPRTIEYDEPRYDYSFFDRVCA